MLQIGKSWGWVTFPWSFIDTMHTPKSPSRETFITLYGDSLSLPRKGVVKNQERYVMKIRDAVLPAMDARVEVLDRGEGAGTISMLHHRAKHDSSYFAGHEFYVALLQSGVVDCAPRPVRQETRDRIGRLPSFLRKRIIRYLHNNRTRLMLRRSYVRTDPDVFAREYEATVEVLLKNHPHVFCLNICPATPSFEDKSPGITRQIASYNSIIRQIVEKHQTRGVRLVDVHEMISNAGDIYDCILREDDHHITPLTHQMIADSVITQLNLHPFSQSA